ncbi:hypothetical protein DYI37_00375 [Fulvimarina endophytica]|uniref:Uncharacterized protein n=1 Tax=Fulvimarina endophytica TaxID=2293836 RepID=A0A371X9V0_9HYPH|nr:hypothetical protein [Fulvimarina endophytica]RFC65981.1 hypothetical protein DYI37_00375 [Fulvimarina endophytica]
MSDVWDQKSKETTAEPDGKGAARLAEIETAFAVIEQNIRRLRELDLADEHPAVVFRPVPVERSDQ